MTASNLVKGDQVLIGRTPATIVVVSAGEKFVNVRYANGATQWVPCRDVRPSTAQRLADNLNQQKEKTQ